MKQLPTFKFEKALWQKDFRFIAGIDEVGRGCFAGPVVTGCVVFKKGESESMVKEAQHDGIVINDSKKLSAKQREKSAEWIKKNALSWGIGEASAVTINRLGIVKATGVALRKAIADANERLLKMKKGQIDFLLVDAFYIPYVKGLRRKNQKAIVKGDSISFSIAAASIIAKVYRDKKMEVIGARTHYKKYDWVSNKGYGAKNHLEALKKYGATSYHRMQFVETYLSKQGS